MWILWTAVGILSFVLMLTVFWIVSLLHMRRDGEAMKGFEKVIFAHRGLHDDTKPENSMAAFAAAVEHGCGIEFDLHLTRDGRLVVMHDGSTGRTCDRDLPVNGSTFAELSALKLNDGSHIPSFEEFLALVDGRSPLLVELKNDGNNAAKLVPAAVKMLRAYHGPYIVESFDPRVLYALKKEAPEMARGQLCQNFMRNHDAPWYMRPLLWSMISNLFTKPDFIAYNTAHRSALPLRVLRAARRRICFWTVRDRADFDRCLKDGDNPIFEKFVP